MQHLRKLLKQTVTAAAYYSGFAWLCLAVGFKRRVAVLMYHRVLPDNVETFSADVIVVTPQTFERQMRFLSRFCNPISVEQCQQALCGGPPLPPRACVVTFDDGWFDNAEYALPILKRYRIPATIFVASDYLDTQKTFWQERIARLLFQAYKKGNAARALFEELQSADILTLPERQARIASRDLVTKMKEWDRSRLDKFIEKTERWLQTTGVNDVGNGVDCFMSWSQASQLQASGIISIESHGESHRPLTTIDSPTVSRELHRSRATLKAKLNRNSRYFAYPNGNHDERTTALVRNAKYELAFTTESGCVLPGDDLMRLKRINISENGTNSTRGFLCRLLAWW